MLMKKKHVLTTCADGTEADVVEQVPGEHPPSDEADQIPVQGRPRRDVAGAGGGDGECRKLIYLFMATSFRQLHMTESNVNTPTQICAIVLGSNKCDIVLSGTMLKAT